MKIYTRTGDTGQTSLLGGTRVPKHHLRIEAYGTVDELNSTMGMIREMNNDAATLKTIEMIQEQLFTIGANLAMDPQKTTAKIPDLLDDDILHLENEIDRMNTKLPELKSFILPGGGVTASWAHIARCICRRTERLVSHLSEEEEVAPILLKYLNRLSDYLFILARYCSLLEGKQEIPWKPRG